MQTRTNPSDADCTPSVTLKLQPFSYLIDSDRKLQWLQDYLSYTEKLNLSLKSLENECDLGIGDLREIITLVLQRPVIRPSLLRNKMNRHIEVNMGDSISSSTLRRWSKGDVREHHASDKKRFIRTVLKIVKLVADEVVASFMLNCYTDEVESFRKTFRSWVMETFRPQCKRVLPSILYDGNHWSGDHNPLEDAITNYYLETVRVDPETTSLGSLEWCDKCHVAFNDPVTPLKCSGCGIKRCEECFGVKIGKEHNQRCKGRIVQLETRPFVCEWCLCEWRLHNSSEAKLLQPDPSVKLCFLCGCDLISREWAACPARCKLCFRLYCERDAAVCSNDFKVAPSSLEVLGIQNKKGGRSVKSPKSESGPRVSSAAVSKEEPLESFRTVALITCLSCVGRPAFLDDRRQAFRRLAKSISLEVRDPLAPANEYKLLRSNVKTNGAAANAVGDFVYDLHWAGFREVSNAALGFLMKILSLQVSPEATHCTLRPCVSPFNMLRLLDNHSYASSVMLEKVCLAHAEWAAKDGEDLLKKVKGLPPLKDVAEKTPNVYKVGFYGGNLFKNGPLVDLVADAIIQFSKRVKFDVFVFGVGSDYKNDGSYIHPPVKQLWDNFDQDRRICFQESDDSAGKLKKFREPQLDVFISLPGWTGVDTDLGKILHCRVAPLQFNWLEFAGVMHAPNLVDFTLLGPAVGQEQRDSDSRERIAEFDAPDSYQPPQSNALTVAVLERQKTQSPKDRAYWGIPAENFVLLVPGSTDRLCEETIYMFFELLLRLPELIVIFLDRPAPMRSFILEKLAEFNRAQDTDSKTGPKVDQSRLIFQAWIHDKCDFWEFIDAVGHEEGGGASICSLGVYTFHTGTSDAMMRRVPHFTWKDGSGLMQQRVSAEVVTSVGLAWPCVSDSVKGTMDAVANYVRDRALQKRVKEHMQKAQEMGVGFYDEDRVPAGLEFAVESAYAQLIAARGDRKQLRDFSIPCKKSPHRAHIESLRQDDHANIAESKRWTLLCASGMEVSLHKRAAEALLGIEEETGAKLHEIVGSGATVFAIRAEFPNGDEGVIKMMKTCCKLDRVHNRTLYREARCLAEWSEVMIRHGFSGLLPKPIKCLKNKSSFFGHTIPNEDDDIVLFLICEYIPRSFWDVAAVHQRNWQEHGILHDSLRIQLLQPMCHGLFWAQRNKRMALVVRDFKPDNLRFRADGSLAIVDTGSGALFPVNRKQHAQLVDRRCTSMSPSLAKSGGGFLRGQKPRPGDRFVVILPAAMKEFELRLGDRGLAVVGGTTRGFTNKMLSLVQASAENGRLVRQFDKNFASKQDTFALLRTVFLVLTYKEGLSMDEWDAKATAAADKGTTGIQAMLLSASTSPSTVSAIIQQPQAFERMVDFLAGGLGSGHELDIERALTHEFITLAILTPHEEKCLQSAEGILFPHGLVCETLQLPEGLLPSLPAKKRLKVENAIIPKLSYKVQPGKGAGMMAFEEIDGDAFLGFYVGKYVRNHICGDEYDVREYPSRFNLTGQGPLKVLKQANKFTCDAQQTLVCNFQFWKNLGNSGPFMNAATTHKSANCTVDRHSAYLDESTDLIWMLVWSKPAGIKLGTYCEWSYNYLAGAGKLWKFWEDRWAQRAGSKIDSK